MDKIDLFDKILKQLYDTNNFVRIEEFSRTILKITDRNLIKSIEEELINCNWATYASNTETHLKITYDGQSVINNYGSYSSYLKSKNKLKKRNLRKKRIPFYISIGITIIFGITTILFSYLNYSADKKNETQESEIKVLNNTIDSLKYELKQTHIHKS